MKRYIIGFVLGFGIVYLTDGLDVLVLNIFIGLSLDFLILIMSALAIEDRRTFEHHDNPDPEDDWYF
jgi:hypothetical protein